MVDAVADRVKLGWIGAGRMGSELVARLLKAGCDVAVYNRTRSKAEPLGELGATVVDCPADLADRDVVFTMVAGPDDFIEVITGAQGVLSRTDVAPRVFVNSSTVSEEASRRVRSAVAERGASLLTAPVSGNPQVVQSGNLTLVVSGPHSAYEEAKPYLELFGSGATYVGEGETALLVKICHNLMLGIISQALAEVTVLAEKGGVARSDFLSFINSSVLGSVFTRYKTPALVNLDWSPTFTPELLRKDFDLGLEAASKFGARLPVSALTRRLVDEMIDQGYVDVDFQALLEMEAKASGLKLVPEQVEVSDGLEEDAAGSFP